MVASNSCTGTTGCTCTDHQDTTNYIVVIEEVRASFNGKELGVVDYGFLHNNYRPLTPPPNPAPVAPRRLGCPVTRPNAMLHKLHRKQPTRRRRVPMARYNPRSA